MTTSNQSISSLEDEVAKLTKLRNERLAQLLSSKSKMTLPGHNSSGLSNGGVLVLPSDGEHDINAILLSQTAALADKNERWNVESLYRMTGVTAFTVREPGPDNRELMGIRIEIFVDGTITSERTDSKTHITIYHHTLPSFFLPRLEQLKTQFLPPPPRTQSINDLVVTTRKFLLLHEWRSFYLKKAREILLKPQDLETMATTHVMVSDFDMDLECLFVQIKWTKGSEEVVEEPERSRERQAMLTLTEDGEVQKVVVRVGDKRMRNMEERISRRRRIGETHEDGAMQDLKELAENLEWVD